VLDERSLEHTRLDQRHDAAGSEPTGQAGAGQGERLGLTSNRDTDGPRNGASAVPPAGPPAPDDAASSAGA
jgi:hypothetical protein